jgi:hypothetical protein
MQQQQPEEQSVTAYIGYAARHVMRSAVVALLNCGERWKAEGGLISGAAVDQLQIAALVRAVRALRNPSAITVIAPERTLAVGCVDGESRDARLGGYWSLVEEALGDGGHRIVGADWLAHNLIVQAAQVAAQTILDGHPAPQAVCANLRAAAPTLLAAERLLEEAELPFDLIVRGRRSTFRLPTGELEPFPGDPRAYTMAELIAPSQMIAIRRLARGVGLVPEEVSREQLRAEFDELNQRAAQWLEEFLVATKELTAIKAPAHLRAITREVVAQRPPESADELGLPADFDEQVAAGVVADTWKDDGSSPTGGGSADEAWERFGGQSSTPAPRVASSRASAVQFPADPLAKSMADLVSPKQLGMIRALARQAGVDPDEESRSVMRVSAEELSKRAASSFIDHLKGLSNGDGPSNAAAEVSDLVTPKQLGLMRALAREAGVDLDEESQAVMRVQSQSLTRRAASSFIDHLKSLNRGATDAA